MLVSVTLLSLLSLLLSSFSESYSRFEEHDYYNRGYASPSMYPSGKRTFFYVALEPNRQGVDELSKYILDSSSNPESKKYGHYLDESTIDRLLRPDHIYQTILDLDAMGIKCVEHSTTVLFCTSYENVLYYHFNNGIPDHLVDKVNFVEQKKEGNHIMRFLTKDRSDWISKVNREPTCGLQFDKNVTYSIPSNGFISRDVLLKTYLDKESGNVNKSRVSVAAIEFMDNEGFSQDDMMMVQNHSCTANNPVDPSHIVGRDSVNPDGESELDMAVIWQSANGVDLWYEDWDGWIFGWAADMFTRTNRPQVASISWGWSETGQCGTIVRYCHDSRAYVDRTNIELMKLAALGVTVTVSSGDAGSPGRTNEGCDTSSPLNPVFPGGSPWILGVGATFLKQTSSTKTTLTNNIGSCPICQYLMCPNVTDGYEEEVTSWRTTGWTSGSGFSNYSYTPKWQAEEVQQYLSQPVQMPDSKYFNRTGRAYPDVAAFGHNCAMYENGSWQGGDGTSCSSPLMAGIIAYLNDYQLLKGRPVLGFVNPLFYMMKRKMPSTFNYVSQGDSACTEVMCCDNRNFGFLPAKGSWDPLSGLGTPRVNEMKKFLDLHANE